MLQSLMVFLHQMEARPTDDIRVAGCPDVFKEDSPEEGREVDEDISGSLC